MLPFPSCSLILIIFNSAMIPLRCTKGADRSQIIQLAGSCVISGSQLFVFSASNLGGTKTNQNQTTKCLWGPIPYLPTPFAELRKICLQKSTERSTPFCSLSLKCCLSTQHSFPLKSRLPSLNDSTRLESLLHSAHQSLPVLQGLSSKPLSSSPPSSVCTQTWTAAPLMVSASRCCLWSPLSVCSPPFSEGLVLSSLPLPVAAMHRQKPAFRNLTSTVPG